MKKEDVHLGDWKRILFGDTPVEFTLEVLVRTLLIYCIFLVIMRLLGKRMDAQLSRNEMAALASLASLVRGRGHCAGAALYCGAGLSE